MVINQTKEIRAGIRGESDLSDIFEFNYPVLVADLVWGFRAREGH